MLLAGIVSARRGSLLQVTCGDAGADGFIVRSGGGSRLTLRGSAGSVHSMGDDAVDSNAIYGLLIFHQGRNFKLDFKRAEEKKNAAR